MFCEESDELLATYRQQVKSFARLVAVLRGEGSQASQRALSLLWDYTYEQLSECMAASRRLESHIRQHRCSIRPYALVARDIHRRHLTLSRIWGHLAGKSQLNVAEHEHMFDCLYCRENFSICLRSKTFDDAWISHAILKRGMPGRE
jgi:hypothetical protein